ncbi:uncharacterized protein EI97DRAFT_501370 [Westerdykella ornata]|uniref:Methyltransferase type 11 domain-containing protein n=1 Tax=Westerdykella ornata TaxID=318751 RepID=A0A6A6JI45_WESOR|nr:uncharacterized protein EI97DRAFT_501370 [Westerdykella ornata]KAF2276067.1 hypothetical protein EI97DRAFT_501370 [Westerdykella ornata]
MHNTKSLVSFPLCDLTSTPPSHPRAVNMFTADLSWTDPKTEKVGERRERKAREKEKGKERSVSSATPTATTSRATASISSGKSAGSKTRWKNGDDREVLQWWPASLKKLKACKAPGGRGKLEVEMGSAKAKVSARLATISSPQTVRLETSTLGNRNQNKERDTVAQPPWIYSSSPFQTLSSGTSVHPPLPYYEAPGIEVDISSHATANSANPSSPDPHRRPRKPPASNMQTLNQVQQIQQLSPHSYVSRIPRVSSEDAEESSPPSPSSGANVRRRKKKVNSVRVQGCLDLEALGLQDKLLREQLHTEELGLPERQEAQVRVQQEDKGAPYASGLRHGDLVAWRPPSEWDIVFPGSPSAALVVEQEVPEKPAPSVGDDSQSSSVEGSSVSVDVEEGVYNATSSESQESVLEEDPGVEEEDSSNAYPLPLTRLQRLIRRMATAHPTTILDRLKQDWNPPFLDTVAREEMQLEKRLWVIAGFQQQNLGRYGRFPWADTGRILLLGGDLAEALHLSSTYPHQHIQHLTTTTAQPSLPPSLPLPQNITSTTYPLHTAITLLPLPYPPSHFTHIHLPTFPSLLPSTHLPTLLNQCHRLLAPGGMLELRLINATPIPGTAGPLLSAWLEQRLAPNLERGVWCSKPCAVVRGWVRDAGFDLPVQIMEGEGRRRVRGAVGDGDVWAEVEVEVGREVWRGIWGGFVREGDEGEGEEEGVGRGKGKGKGREKWWWEEEGLVRECREWGTVWVCASIYAFKK